MKLGRNLTLKQPPHGRRGVETCANCPSSSRVSLEMLAKKFPSAVPGLVSWWKMLRRGCVRLCLWSASFREPRRGNRNLLLGNQSMGWGAAWVLDPSLLKACRVTESETLLFLGTCAMRSRQSEAPAAPAPAPSPGAQWRDLPCQTQRQRQRQSLPAKALRSCAD